MVESLFVAWMIEIPLAFRMDTLMHACARCEENGVGLGWWISRSAAIMSRVTSLSIDSARASAGAGFWS